MPRRKESDFAEVLVDRLLLESFANEQSPYYVAETEKPAGLVLDKFRNRLKWHIDHSLSKRQRQVIRHYLRGKTERDIAQTIGVTQQVVNIYKHRAIKKLQKVMSL